MPFASNQARREYQNAYAKRPEQRAAATVRMREWRKENPERAKASERSRRTEVKLEALSICGPGGRIQCSWPGCIEADPDVLTLDHVNDDGRDKRQRGEGRGDQLYRNVVAGRTDITTLQTLCANHNLKKEVMRRRSA